MQVEDVMKTLKEVPVGETVTVAKLVGEGAVKDDYGYGRD